MSAHLTAGDCGRLSTYLEPLPVPSWRQVCTSRLCHEPLGTPQTSPTAQLPRSGARHNSIPWGQDAELQDLELTPVRINVTWDAIAHAGPGQVDSEYLAYLRSLLESLRGTGLVAYVVSWCKCW